MGFGALWWTVGAGARAVYRIRRVDPPLLDGAYVLVANHASFLDPLLVGSAHHRRITFMMTAVVYRDPWLRWFYRLNRAIPVDARGSNRDAMRAARAVLRRGEILGVFPEGGLSRDALPMLGNPGAVSLMLAERVPVVPLWIEGSARALAPGSARVRFPRIELRYGAPIDAAEFEPDGVDRKRRLALATRRIMDAIAALGGTESREAWLERHRGPATGIATDP